MKYVVFLSVLALVLCAGGAFAVAYTEQYEMDAAPNTVAGTAYGNVLTIGPGSGTNGPGGFVFSGGIGTFLDDGASSGNQGYYATGNWGVSFTCDFRIRDLAMDQPAWPGPSKDFSFKGGGNGRGLQFDDGAQFVSGTGITGTGGDVAGEWGEWVVCRVTIDIPTNTATLYDWRGSWFQVAQTTMGGSGWAGELTGSEGFAIGSMAGSSTTLSNYELDYFRVYLGSSDVNAVYDLIPEPGSMMALASGLIGMAGFALRRRRA